MLISAAIYARTSPDCPLTSDEQVEHLRAIAAERGWAVAHVFTDRPTSARKGQDRRSGEMALSEAIRAGDVEKVLIWSVCRVGKSLADLVAFMETCRVGGVGLYLCQQSTDTATSNGMSLFDLASMLALHLHQTRRDRILRGQAAARALSVRFGRPRIGKAKVEKAKQFLAIGKGVREVARLAGISPASCSRLKNSMGSAASSI